jgi:hypothetical protein
VLIAGPVIGPLLASKAKADLLLLGNSGGLLRFAATFHAGRIARFSQFVGAAIKRLAAKNALRIRRSHASSLAVRDAA